MQIIVNETTGGERAMYKLSDARLSHVTFTAGESCLKHGTDLFLSECEFQGKYPLWINTRTTVEKCLLRETARSGLWYVKDFQMKGCRVECPKTFRDSDGVTISGSVFVLAQETLWNCRNVEIRDSEFQAAPYLLAHSENVRIHNMKLSGDYLLQWGRNIEIFDSELASRDALWNSENATCYNCTIDGEYLGWHSKNLHLVNCRIKGQQPLCYCENLVLDNCTFDPDAVLAFEYCDVRADIRGAVTSVKNPTTGSITADSIGEIILDGNALPPANCRITERSRR